MEGTISKQLINMLSEFLVCDINSKAIGGITYTFTLKNEKDKPTYEKYAKIKEEALRCGFGPSEAFRVYEVSNGFIFDMDLSIAKYLTAEISRGVAKQNKGATPVGDLIGDMPEKRRREDMVLLGKHLKSQFKKGKRSVEVALFSKNNVPRIEITGEDKNGKQVAIKYNAYAIRHWDIEDVNAHILIPEGIKVFKIEPCEILPSKTGVRFILHMAEIPGLHGR